MICPPAGGATPAYHAAAAVPVACVSNPDPRAQKLLTNGHPLMAIGRTFTVGSSPGGPAGGFDVATLTDRSVSESIPRMRRKVVGKASCFWHCTALTRAALSGGWN